MGRHCGLVVLVGVALLLAPGRCDVSCKGIDGRPGEAGIPGRDGPDGLKGDKGDSAVRTDGAMDKNLLLMLKGDVGSRGDPGIMGPKGYSGDIGLAGFPGAHGPAGPPGKRLNSGGQPSMPQAHSAFSMMRTDHSYPAFGKVVTYQTTAVNNPGDFSAATGYFTCRVPGVYYFTFISVAKVSVCLRIASDPPFEKLGFCDYNRNANQVLSGGVVLQLAAGKRVWLESFKESQTEQEGRDTQEKMITFSGFLLFSDAQ
uniref:C1q domain-containing protein n=1 Tax=Mola mola TaxID=94237 RepID=A0A3Q4BFN5_MOLML